VPDRQEIWAAGVTYERSREARVAESGLVDVYTRAHESDRPELFFKAPAERVVAPGGAGRLRADSAWDACEPELVVVVTAAGEIAGYMIGNDLSSRSIEGENPLYLPQAKVYTDSCVLGAGWTPAWCVPDILSATIAMSLVRHGNTLWSGSVSLSKLRRAPEELIAWLFRELDFPAGVLLFTGTGLVAPDHVVLDEGDEAIIAIDGLGQLRHELYRQPPEALAASQSS
jgi:2-dehydro-3-deoxy-D-arabinonate dehydratase